MVDRRQSRAHQRPSLEALEPEGFVVVPALVEHLEQCFPVKAPRLEDWGLDGAVNLALRQAEEDGKQAVIAYVRNLVKTGNEA